jgi:hypothetical protein
MQLALQQLLGFFQLLLSPDTQCSAGSIDKHLDHLNCGSDPPGDTFGLSMIRATSGFARVAARRLARTAGSQMTHSKLVSH